jgi:hypothetical protein
MQVEGVNKRRTPYTNTLRGIENSVLDGMDVLNQFYPYVFSEFDTAQRGKLAGLPDDNSAGHHLIEGFALLAYNAGLDPIKTYKSGSGNPNYIKAVSDKQNSYVPQTCGSEYQDSALAADLYELQARFTNLLH